MNEPAAKDETIPRLPPPRSDIHEIRPRANALTVYAVIALVALMLGATIGYMAAVQSAHRSAYDKGYQAGFDIGIQGGFHLRALRRCSEQQCNQRTIDGCPGTCPESGWGACVPGCY
jgi:hypothetical protein